MSQIYQAHRRAQQAPAEQKLHTNAPGPSLSELAAGAMPSTEQMGRRVDLPEAIREKMEASFGADFSGVKVYESQTVADAGAQAMTMGSNVAFAPGQLDLASTSGQALLGHELSHVVSQARGESAGQGFLADSGLEAQADRQGALAAQGESVYSGPVSPLSASAVPASAAGPVQARKTWSRKNASDEAAIAFADQIKAVDKTQQEGAAGVSGKELADAAGLSEEQHRGMDTRIMRLIQDYDTDLTNQQENHGQAIDTLRSAAGNNFAAVLPTLVESIRRYNSTDFSDLYDRHEQTQFDTNVRLFDRLSLGASANTFLQEGIFSNEQLANAGLTKEELDEFKNLAGLNYSQQSQLQLIGRMTGMPPTESNRNMIAAYRSASDNLRRNYDSGGWRSRRRR